MELEFYFVFLEIDDSGSCPPVPLEPECPPSSLIVNSCLVDSDCEIGKQCCSNGCTLSCVTSNKTNINKGKKFKSVTKQSL